MPPVIVAAATIAGAIITVHFLRKEWQRVNRELDSMERIRATAPRKLRRDTVTGVWRPE